MSEVAEGIELREGETPLDENIIPLLNAINGFAGLQTIGSCGGHDNPGRGGWPAGTWYVKFTVAWTAHGRYALEFLAWLINDDYARSGAGVLLYPFAYPPYLNHPGKMLEFCLEGKGEGADPLRLAKWIDETRAKYYLPPRPRGRRLG